MEAKELRIGNLVMCGEATVLINDIGNAYHTHKPYPKDRFNWVSPKTRIKYYNHILLTEEWLIKFGFEKYMGVYRIKFRDDLYLRCSFYKGILGLVIDEYDFLDDRETVALNPVQFVHQLQNLYFALTGDELTR